jgi:transposase
MDGISIQSEVILRVDTHLDTHVGVVINHQSKVIGTLTSIPTNKAGYLKLLTWARSLGNVQRAGENTTTSNRGDYRVHRDLL